MNVTVLDGRGFARFLVAGTYFLKKYRQVLNDLNVFPVPDGDTGTNMFLTARSAMLQAGRERSASLATISAAAAQGSLMGARGNSGVIISQMLRGFAHHIRHRESIDTFTLATAIREAVAAAKQALLRPVEGTIISVAEAAAEAAYKISLHEPDLYRFGSAVVRAANEALDRTPDQLPVLKEAGVVDAGGAGFVYFIEGALRFLPEARTRTTAFPRRPERNRIFTPTQIVGENKFCTEFVLEEAACTLHALRDLLASRGESLLVIGEPPTLKVHIHTDDPEKIQELAARHGRVIRVKVDNMELQHTMLVVEKPTLPYSIAAVVPGAGFERIMRELGAEVLIDGSHNPAVRDVVLAINKCLSDVVYLFLNDPNIAPAAGEAAKLTTKTLHIIPTRDILGGIAGLFAFRAGTGGPPTPETLLTAAGRVRSGQVFFAGKDATFGGVTVACGKPTALADGKIFVEETLFKAMGSMLVGFAVRDGALITLYYGGSQREKDVQRAAHELQLQYPKADIEYYYGGMKNAEYWISVDE